ncbi:HNH endonuclease [Metaclostridioides mangenotii]|uniref:HNH endonuclease n=1 Tax=Metaclostridioides mangenotii TaxID=1540 RepID=UPI001AEB7067|nr:HNH endonuclease [Clostridioides mangenotii]
MTTLYYLEVQVHHIIWLSKGGNDDIDNTVALCPNCHKKMHILNLDKDLEHLSNLNIHIIHT